MVELTFFQGLRTIMVTNSAQNAPSGGAQAGAGGSAGQEPDHQSGDDDASDDTGEARRDKVDYKTYDRTLSQYKKEKEARKSIEAERDALKRERELAEREKAEKNGEHLKVIESLKLELEAKNKALGETQGQLKDLTDQEIRRRKYAAFVDVLGVQVDHKVARGLVDPDDLDKIAIDPETGEIDQLAVSRYAEKFRKEYPSIVGLWAARPGMPNGKPGAGGGKDYINHSEYVRLCGGTKEERAQAAAWGLRDIKNPGTIVNGK
jgi:hypothetical protein